MSTTVERALKRLARFNGEAGSCWDAASNLDRLNEVREMIYERGDYEGTTEWGCVAIEDCACIYLPAHLEAVRHAWIGEVPILTRSRAYMSIDMIGRQSCCSCRPDQRRAVQMTDVRRPVVRTPSKPYALRVIGGEDEDEELVFRCVDIMGDVQEHRVVPKQVAETYGAGIKDVLSVVKPVTKGKVVVFADLEDGTEVFLAEYQPWQENPAFTQMRISNYTQGDCTCPLVVFAKRKFRNLMELDELLDITSTLALSFGYQALNARDGNRDDEYRSKLVLMTEQLDQVDTNLQPNVSTVEFATEKSIAQNPIYDNGGTY